MKLPRWTAWIALGWVFAMIGLGVPRPVSDPYAGAAAAKLADRPPAPAPARRVVVLGIDGLDPEILAEVIARFPERMRNFAQLIGESGLHPLGTSTPPQSPVAWSNFITGLDPGGHGVFDFIHRDPVTRMPGPGTAKVEANHSIELVGGWQFPWPPWGGDSASNRSGKAFWTILGEHGIPADVWRMPANFPVEPGDGMALSGMMTPALDSAYGEATLYTTDPPVDAGLGGARVVGVSMYDDRVDTRLPGPPNNLKQGDPTTSVPLVVHIDRASNAVAIDVDGSVLVLQSGQWSDFVEVSYSLLPMHVLDISGVVRFYLRRIEPEFELYASPVNFNPLNPVTPISEPADLSAELADRAQGGIGIYYTQGMPEDVNALKREMLTDLEFMQQSALVHAEGERMLDWSLDRYLARPEGGLFFFYVSGVDLCGHMMWRHRDEHHPMHDAALAAEDSSAWSGRAGSTWKDVIADLYLQMDPLVGHLRERIGEDATLIVMSDHGFAPYGRKFNLNTWLWQNGYLVLKEGVDPLTQRVEVLVHTDWTRTRAYGIGFNGLYVNLAGRERDNPDTEDDESGIVRPGEEYDALVAEIASRLEAVTDPDRGDRRVVLRADIARDVYTGDRTPEAPDIIVGYDSDYGNSDEASLGRVEARILADNLGGTFNGSHLMAPEVVAGTLLSNRPVLPGAHRLEDLTVEVLARFGIPPQAGMRGHRVLAD
ncbi:MAG TPA: alkaline phosphatase family protein [Planctomycetota bacterium]|nr:alkaline phosphatase family protein [Planctomycetota bacterium]